MKPNFEWDAEKARLNYGKHKISFEEAITVFSDLNSITQFDPDHSGHEQRFIDIGLSDQGRLLVVVYTERGSKLRIISCRKATRNERGIYYAQNNT